MKIAIFTDTYPPFINGVSTSAFNLVQALKEHGHDVVVVAPRVDDGKLEFSDGIIKVPGLELKKMYGYRVTNIYNKKIVQMLRDYGVELIHNHPGNGRLLAFAKRLVGKYLCRAAHDGRPRVNGNVARYHSNVVSPEHLNQVEELLAYQRLYWRRVVGRVVCAKRHKARTQRHERLPGACGRAKDNVVLHGNGEQGLLLMVPEAQPSRLDPLHKDLQGLLALQGLRARVEVWRKHSQRTLRICVNLWHKDPFRQALACVCNRYCINSMYSARK